MPNLCLPPLHAITGLGATFAWGDEQQHAFNAIKLALIEATALAQLDSEGEFVLDTDASAVTISGFLPQWQGPPGYSTNCGARALRMSNLQDVV